MGIGLRVVALLVAAALAEGRCASAAESVREPLADLELVRVPGGTFDMGDLFGGGRSNERPVHSVAVRDFCLGRYEVTVAQFRRFVEATGYKTGAERQGFVVDVDAAMGSLVRRAGISWREPGLPLADDHPVTWVSWEDATAFTRWLAEKTGKPYRLPTEAEWEFAARSGGKPEKWAGVPHGEEPGEHAWYAANSGGHTHPVGLKKPNGLGLFDLSGNVWEWCLDGGYAYAPGPVPATPAEPVRAPYPAIRGGSWRVTSDIIRVFYRSAYKPDYAHSSIGFRVALEVRAES